MKSILCFPFLLLCLFSFAQRPTVGMNAFSFGITGLQNVTINAGTGATGGVLYRRYLTDLRALRVSAMLNSVINTQKSENDGLRNTTSSNNGNLDLGIGLQQAFTSDNRFEPYLGLDLTLGTGWNRIEDKREVVDETKSTDPFDKNGDFDKTVKKYSMPFRVGLNPLVGFNYYLVKNFAVGAEFRYSIRYSYQGAGTSTLSRVSGGNAQPDSNTQLPSSNILQFSGGGNGLITLTVLF